MGIADTFGRAGGARGEDDGGQVIGFGLSDGKLAGSFGYWDFDAKGDLAK